MFTKSLMSGRFGLAACLALLVSAGYAEEKSIWTKFVEFFTPTSEVEGDGPLYDELRELDRKISRVEGKYARERRPINKERYKKELNQLREDREKLVKKIEAEEGKKGSSSSKAKSSSSSAAKRVSSSSVAQSSSSVASSASVAVAVDGCKPDTVYVRDTVVVHDTLYVMLAPKPESAPKADSSAAPEKK